MLSVKSFDFISSHSKQLRLASGRCETELEQELHTVLLREREILSTEKISQNKEMLSRNNYIFIGIPAQQLVFLSSCTADGLHHIPVPMLMFSLQREAAN